MKKFCMVIGFIFIVIQLFLRFIYSYDEYIPVEKPTTSNLTSLMISFEHMNQYSTVYCLEDTLQYRYKLEFKQLEYYRLNQSYVQPSINKYSKQNIIPELPYFYSLWKTSLLLPRLITPCEHQVYVKLMKTFNEICQKNGIEYMISHGTLLGSYRNHDILPYDDDIDILIHIKYYSRLSEINKFKNETDWEFYLKTSRNMKFYFRSSPSAGNYEWKWPFIGIQFYIDNNSTYIKLKTYIIKKDIIFPLVLRPIATLWLPGPRNVHRYLNALRKNYYSNLSIDEKCLLKDYSHRDEKRIYKSTIVNCTQLYNVYPYIRRICDNDYCQEYFMLNNITTLYVLTMIKDK